MTDYQIKQIALRLYKEEAEKKIQREKELAKINEKKRIEDKISYELEQLRGGSQPPSKDDITILKEQQSKLFYESKKLQQIRKTLETLLNQVRNKMATIYEERYQAKERFAKAEKENDLELVYKYKGAGYHNPLHELAEEALKAGIIPDTLLNENRRITLLELQEKEKQAGIIWSEEKELEKKILDLNTREFEIESESKNLGKLIRRTEQNLRDVLNKTNI